MEWRNPKYNAYGTIDVEILHPVHGWIPFTADSNDTKAGFNVASLIGEIVNAGPVDPYVAPPPQVPTYISKVQLKRATQTIEVAPGITLWDAVKAAIAGAGEDTQEEWDLIQMVPRNDPTVLALAAALNKTSEEMDAVWILGATL